MRATASIRVPSVWNASAAAALMMALVTPVLAKTCGDVDGSGSVSVTDGVNVLGASVSASVGAESTGKLTAR